MTFLSAIEPPKIHSLIEAFPDFESIYQEITDFVKEPKELMSMFSKELYMMDKNLERLMVEEAQEEARLAKEEAARDVATAREAIASVKAELKDIIAARNAVVAELNNAMSERNNAIIERDIFKLSCKNKTSEEIAEELGYKNHSGVLKRIRKIGLAYEKFTGEDYGFENKRIT